MKMIAATLMLALAMACGISPARQVLPDDLRSKAAVAYCDLKLGNIEAATVEADAVLALNQRSAMARAVRGLLLAQQGDAAAAAVDLRYAFRDAVVRHDAVSKYAQLLGAAGHHAQAWLRARRLTKEAPSDPRSYVIAAQVRRAQGLPLEALRHARRALGIDPSNTAARTLLNQLCKDAEFEGCPR